MDLFIFSFLQLTYPNSKTMNTGFSSQTTPRLSLMLHLSCVEIAAYLGIYERGMDKVETTKSLHNSTCNTIDNNKGSCINTVV